MNQTADRTFLATHLAAAEVRDATTAAPTIFRPNDPQRGGVARKSGGQQCDSAGLSGR
ncbi:hypothetical protein FAGKG844_10120 [Frankia sp. AgKG'84/4]